MAVKMVDPMWRPVAVVASMVRKMSVTKGRRRARPGEARAWAIAATVAHAFDPEERPNLPPPHALELHESWRWGLRHRRRWCATLPARKANGGARAARDVVGRVF